MNILIVDDVAENISLMQAMIEGAGYGVVSARNGKEALERLRKGTFDLIVSDILMPVMDGFQLCKECKTHLEWREIPFVFYTATYTEKKDEEFALALGAERFVIKPQEPKRFLEILKEVLDISGIGGGEGKLLLDDETYFAVHDEHIARKLGKKIADMTKLNLELRKSEEKYRLLAENVQDVIFVLDLDLNYTYVSPSVKLLRGYEPAELLKQPALETVPPASRDLVVKTFSEAVEWEKAGQGDFKRSWTIEVEMLCKDGTTVWSEVKASLIRGEKNQLTGILGITRDITERKQAAAERELLMAAIEQAGESIVITDPAGTIQYVNPAFEPITGYAPKYAIGKNPRMLKSGKQDQVFYQDLWETITSGKTWAGHIVNKRKDGRLYTEEATISPVCDASGRIVNYVAVKRDITEKLLLDQQFRQAQKLEAVGRLTSGIAHDFNNLLTTIIGNAAMAVLEVGKDEPLYEVINDIKEAGERAAGLTRQLLAFSRRQVLQPEVINLNEVVQGIGGILRRIIGEDVELKTFLSSDLGRVQADVGQIEQVIMNLTVNSRDAMPEGGKLTIETANVELDEEYAKDHVAVTPGPYVRLSVSDTGIGISREVQAQMFEPFFTTKEKGRGTGLGLSTVYGIVKQSGGNIWVYSEVGRGTAFKVYLPRVDKAIDGENRGDIKTETLSGLETVLVVEDEERVRNLAVRVLKGYGYKVLMAGKGQEAMEISKGYEDPIHLLLTDVVMPRMSGRELAEGLGGARPEMKVLFMSGYTDDAIVHDGVLDPGISFIQKPFTPEGLARKVREVLDS